jgi:hypothetical protein
MPQWRSVYETNERIQYKWSSTFIGTCLQYWTVFPVCADWLLLIDLWHQPRFQGLFGKFGDGKRPWHRLAFYVFWLVNDKYIIMQSWINLFTLLDKLTFSRKECHYTFICDKALYRFSFMKEYWELWNTSPMLCQLSYAVRTVRVGDISELSLVPSISTILLIN